MDKYRLIELFEKNELFLQLCIEHLIKINSMKNKLYSDRYYSCEIWEYEIVANELLKEFDEYDISEMLVDARDYLLFI
mgnify:FL=1